MSKIRKILEYPYIKILNRIGVGIKRFDNYTYRSLTSISIWNLIFFYLIVLGIITFSLAVFVGVFSILKDIF